MAINLPDLPNPTNYNIEGQYIMGLTFHATEDVTISGIRFYSPAVRVGTGAALYALGGSPAGLAQKMQDIIIGWNAFLFDTPVDVSANATEDHFAGVLLPAPSEYTNLAQTDPFTQEPIVFDTAGAFIATAPSLTLSVSPHKGGSSDGGQIQWGNGNWFGIQLILDADVVPTEPINFSVVRTNDTTATLTWGTLEDAPYGVSVLRAPGVHTVDGDGDSFGEEGYDPSNIPGATIIAQGVVSPYVNSGLDSTLDYSYALQRTGPDA